MNAFRRLLITATALAATATTAMAEPKVVTSIKPVHSLVAAVMAGVGEPELIIGGASSPHTYSLKPSQAASLQQADIVFWIGPQLEAFLEKPLGTIAGQATAVALIESHGLIRLPFREGGAFEAHDHDEHAKDGHMGHDEHDEHAEGDHEGHDHEKHAYEDHGEDNHHSEGVFDSHLWLDPANAKAFVHEIEETLAAADPENAARYKANADRLNGELEKLIQDVTHELDPVRAQGFVEFHDAYQYFEKRFGLHAAGSITVNPEVRPGAERIREIQDRVKAMSAACVFSEPQFDPKMVSIILEGTEAKTGILDPLGASIAPGPEMYFQLINGMAASMKTCLTPSS